MRRSSPISPERPGRLAFAVAIACLASARLAAAQEADALAVRAVRYYRTESSGQTRVRTLIQVPLTVLEPAAGALSYAVTVRVADQAGMALHSEQWMAHAPAGARQPGAFGLDVVDFAVAPGKYAITVQVRDSVSGRQLEATAPLEGFSSRPDASDLLLASSMRTAEAQDTIPRLGEMRRGNTLFAAAATLRLTPLRTEAYYLIEAYNDGAEETGTLSLAVMDDQGKTLLQTQPSAVRVASGGGLLKGKLDLDGLPPGSYQLRAQLTLGGRSLERQAALVMAPLEETLQRNVARIEQEKVTDEGFFGHMDVAALDSVFLPLVHIGTPSELKLWNKGMSEEAKRRYLTEFWQKRDPDGPGGRNEARERFYAAIEFANRTYWEKKTPGWRTDRGRIFARYGAPDELLHREQEGRAPPYEVWKYQRTGEWYIFADLTSLDNWKLMVSSDLKEARQPDWRTRLTEEAVLDAGRFLQVDFYASGSSTTY